MSATRRLRYGVTGLFVLLASLIAAGATSVPARAAVDSPANVWFTSADRNVGCWVFASSQAGCAVHHSHWKTSVSCRGIDKLEWFLVTATSQHDDCSGGALWIIGQQGPQLPWSSPVLRPGHTVTAGRFRCAALTTTAIRCTNTAHHGFQVSGNAYRIF